MNQEFAELVDGVREGDGRSLARLISHVENRREGYRDAIRALHGEDTDTHVVGVTGSPGAGKSTLVDALVDRYRDRGDTVGVIAVDPASPYTGGAILGDRVRVQARAADPEVFFRSMSARGTLGGLASATGDAVTALEAAGKDVVIVETVGAGQNEVDVVRTADTVTVLVTPGSGDDVQMLKAGILEIADLFVVNKADKSGADRTVMELEAMIEEREGGSGDDGNGDAWRPPVLETVATGGTGVDDVLEGFDRHRGYLEESGQLVERRRERYADALRHHLEDGVSALVERRIADAGGMEALASRMADGDTDPYALRDRLLAPVEECVDRADPE